MHSLKKLVGLIILYSIIIVGIFVIQFNSDSPIRKNLNGIRVTLAQTENSDGTTGLKNSFQISYGGIVFSADEYSPLKYFQDGIERAAKLISFEEQNERTCILNFENEISLAFSLNNENENPSFRIEAKMPENVQSISVNFAPNSNYTIREQTAKSIILANKKNDAQEFSLTAPAFTQNALTLQSNLNSAYYALYVEKEEFTLDDIENFALASKEIYEATLKSLSNSIVENFINNSKNDASFASSLNEQTVISFLAEMARLGRYNEGINTIPRSFVNGNRRTYLSTPFLGGMAATLPTLSMQVENFNNMIARAVQEQTLDIFTVQNIAQYMYTQGNRGNVARLARMPGSLTELNLNVQNAAGIIRSYIYLKQQNSSMATPLEVVLELCAQKIVDSISFDGEKVTLFENELPLSDYAALAAGDALIQYARQFEQDKIEKYGYSIVNSYLDDIQSLDLRALGEFYALLIHGNSYYPHFELIRTRETSNIWAYTNTSDITYSRNEDLTIILDLDFPVGLSHYTFIAGITPFNRIQIYDMYFRTDENFETYNSSGYVYRANAQTLLLKSSHRNRHEIVRLYYRAPQPTPVEEIPAAAENSAENAENAL